MLSQPSDYLRCRGGRVARGQGRAIDQNHAQAQRTGRLKLGLRAATAGIFSHHMGNAVRLQQRHITVHGEGAARDDDLRAAQGQVKRCIDQTQQVSVLWATCERQQVLLANRQKNSCWLGGQRSHCGFYIGDVLPVIAGLCLPGRSLKSQQRHASCSASLHGIRTHLRGERVRSIDHMGDAISLQPSLQAGNATKAAHTGGQGLRNGRKRSACIRKNRVYLGAGQGLGQFAGLGRAAQQKNTFTGGAGHV